MPARSWRAIRPSKPDGALRAVDDVASIGRDAVSDAPDAGAFAILIAIMVAGFLLLALATWYTARRSKR